MSIENSFIDLATAIRELAASNVKAAEINAASTDKMAAAYAGSMAAYSAGQLLTGELNEKKDARDVGKATDSKKPETATAKGQSPDAGAASKKADAKKPDVGAADQGASANSAGSAKGDNPALDYEKDVKPVLMQVATKLGKPKLQALLAEYGGSGPKLTAEQLPLILAAANELLAG